MEEIGTEEIRTNDFILNKILHLIFDISDGEWDIIKSENSCKYYAKEVKLKDKLLNKLPINFTIENQLIKNLTITISNENNLNMNMNIEIGSLYLLVKHLQVNSTENDDIKKLDSNNNLLTEFMDNEILHMLKKFWNHCEVNIILNLVVI